MGHNPNPKIRTVYEGTVEPGPMGSQVDRSLDWSGVVRPLPQRLDWPLRWKKPRRIFCCNMSDLFHPNVPFEFIARVFGMMRAAERHTFQVLTKRPERMLRFFSSWGAIVGDADRWPLPNVWLGVTAENQAMADARIPLLLQVSAAVRFVSVEPCLGPVDLTRYLSCEWYAGEPIPPRAGTIGGQADPAARLRPRVGWAISGGETGLGARPALPDWFRSIRDQCQAARVPYFHKQNGEWEFTELLRGHECDFQATGGYPTSCMGHPGCEGCAPYSRYGNAKSVEMEDGYMVRVGKGRAGHLLDGVEHHQFPDAR